MPDEINILSLCRLHALKLRAKEPCLPAPDLLFEGSSTSGSEAVALRLRSMVDVVPRDDDSDEPAAHRDE